MGLRLRKSIKLFPGVRINLSKSGVSTSLGVPGATVNVKSGRKSRATVGVPVSRKSATGLPAISENQCAVATRCGRISRS
jgi:hypothetical protein